MLKTDVKHMMTYLAEETIDYTRWPSTKRVYQTIPTTRAYKTMFLQTLYKMIFT